MNGDDQRTKSELIAELDALRKAVIEPGAEGERQPVPGEQLYRIVTEISRDAVEVVNEAGVVIFVNPAMEDVWGLKPEECIGKPMRDSLELVHPDDRARVSEEYSVVEKEGGTIYYAPMRCWHQDGRWMWIKAIATSYVNDSGERCVLEVTQDITEQVEAEERRHQIVEQTKEAQRLESLGVLAGGIAHDFNNILVAVLGYSDLAMRNLSQASPVRPLIEKIIKGARRAADLCSQMLAYSGKRQLEVDAVDLNEVVGEISDLLAVSVSKKAVLEYELAPNLPAVKADATQLPQVAMNLIINASEAIGEECGVISVSTGAMECDYHYLKKIVFASEDSAVGTYVYLEVSDTGCGMDEATKKKIFDPFFTTKFTGRGLGLATVLGIARAHQGLIEVDSEPGKGATIKILFPAIQQPAKSLKQGALPLNGWRGTGTVLLVDDEEFVLDVGHMMLEERGFSVRTARDGIEAVEIYRKHQDEIVCVVLDLMMPNMDGEQAFRELRRIRGDVKIVLSSGYQEQDVAERVVKMGFAGFVKKPYVADTLIEELRRALEGDSPSSGGSRANWTPPDRGS